MKGNKKKVVAFQNGKSKKKPEKRFSNDSFFDATEPKRRRKFTDENIESSDEEGGRVDSEADEEENKEDEIEETVGEIRLRKAVEMVEKFRASEKKHEEEEEDTDSDEESRREKDGNRDSRIAKVLQQEQMEDSGRLRRIIASRVQKPEVSEGFRFLIKHRQPVTAVALSDDDSRGFSASKDGTIMHWDVESGKTEKYVWPSVEILKSHGVKDPQGRVKKHNRQVLALAVSSDGRYLASGGLDRHIHLWDTRTREHIQAFPGHKGPVSCLTFRQGTSELFSGSFDRSVKIWNAEDRTYVSTLFGHQSDVLTIDSLRKERVLTVGRDRTMHLWKVPEESQLVFRAPASSLECCCFISNDEFLSGSDDGSIQHWSVLRKKPIHILKNAHSPSNEHVPLPESNGLSNGHLDENAQDSPKHGPNAFSWVNSVAVCRNSDLAASGAGNGLIRLWEIENDKGIKPLFELPLGGFINSLAFAKSGKFLIAGVGKEHRLGRWGSIPAARDGVTIHQLKLSK